MKNRFFFTLLSFFLILCQLFSTTGVSAFPGSTLEDGQEQGFNGAVSYTQNQANPVSIEVNRSSEMVGTSPLKEWVEVPYKHQGDDLPIKIEKISNIAVTNGLTKDQKSLLSRNGFAVLLTEEEQFADIRNQVSTNFGQPYYLTTDAAFHAMHITFDALLKKLEEQVFLEEAIYITGALFQKVSSYSAFAKGTTLEPDVKLAEEYLAVAMELFKEENELPPDMEKAIQPQIDQIMSENEGRIKSVLIPNFEDDYSAYRPLGHYAENAKLENYFRGMTWLGRVAFKFKDIKNPKFKPSRASLIITFCLRQDSAILSRYSKMMDTLGLIVGPTDDGGPIEMGALMDSIYGSNMTFDFLKDEQIWQQFLSRVDELPQPQINSTFVNSTKELNAERSWRLMGQRFTLDAVIFQNLIYDKVGSKDRKREFPSGLDVMAVLGSPAAIEAQRAAGQMTYLNYPSQMDKMQKAAQAQTQPEWLGSFYSGWLYSFFPQLQPKGASYPPAMQTTAWQNRELTSALGSWAELKHDTTLYTKMPEFIAGGGPPSSPSAPGYVEANPNVFYRLAYILQAFKDELELRGYTTSTPENAIGSGSELSFLALWDGLESLANQFIGLGDIAVKELQGEKLSSADFDLIQSPLGPLEDRVDFAQKTGQNMKLPPVPVISVVAGVNEAALEAGIGRVNRIYVVVPINGQLQVAQGGVFSYYEVLLNRSDRYSDAQWQKKLTDGQPYFMPYTEKYIKRGGKELDSLAFRIGDVYLITQKGGKPPLNVRVKPSLSGDLVDMLEKNTYIEITDGPEEADKLRWWKIKVFETDTEGWVAENPEWYARAHGQ